jgi:hypothetical protein
MLGLALLMLTGVIFAALTIAIVRFGTDLSGWSLRGR